MNISKISFCGNNQDRYNDYGANRPSTNPHVTNASRTRDTLRKEAGFNEDSFNYTTKNPAVETPTKKPINKWKLGLIGLALCQVLHGAYACSTAPNETTSITIEASVNLEDIAEDYGVDASFLKWYNHLDSNVVAAGTEITIPSNYDYIGEKIEKLQEDLYRPTTSDKKKTEIQNRIAALEEKRELQKQIATSYTDGEYVYFKISIPSDETATEFQQKYKNGINVEDFKAFFDIKDNAIREHNNISFTWEYDPQMGSYKDYSNAKLRNTQIIKVPTDSIKTK